jgi:hypothetical protein
MGQIVLMDNDALLKLACYGLLHETLDLFGCATTDVKPTFRTSNWHIEYFNEAIGFPEVADRALSQ